jgi:hypothetical protein
VGLYTKIGRQVTVTANILLTAKGTSTGTVKIDGLPFTVKNDYAAMCPISLRFNRITFANAFQGYVVKNTTDIYLMEITEDGVMSTLDETNFADDSEILLAVTYFTD